MLILLAFVLGFIGGLTYARFKLLTFLLLVLVVLLAADIISLSL